MRITKLWLILFIAVTHVHAGVVAVDGVNTVTDLELRNEAIRLLPKDKIAEWASNGPSVRQTSEQLLLLKHLANKAKIAKIDEEERVRVEIQLATERILAGAYQRKVDESIKYPSFEGRAKEVYLTSGDKFKSPDIYELSQILVEAKCRTKDQSKLQAEEAEKAIKAGMSFEDAVVKYSDDPSAAKNKGYLGELRSNVLDPDFLDAIKSLKAGEVSKAFRTQYGYHVVKLKRVTPGTKEAAESVVPILIEELKQAHASKTRDNSYEEFRKTPKLKFEEANILSFGEKMKKEFNKQNK